MIIEMIHKGLGELDGKELIFPRGYIGPVDRHSGLMFERLGLGRILKDDDPAEPEENKMLKPETKRGPGRPKK